MVAPQDCAGFKSRRRRGFFLSKTPRPNRNQKKKMGKGEFEVGLATKRVIRASLEGVCSKVQAKH